MVTGYTASDFRRRLKVLEDLKKANDEALKIDLPIPMRRNALMQKKVLEPEITKRRIRLKEYEGQRQAMIDAHLPNARTRRPIRSRGM